MQIKDDQLLFSPSNLVNYSRSPFITWMDRWALEDKHVKSLKDTPDAMLSYLAEKGYAHEDSFLEELRKTHRNIVTIDTNNLPQSLQVEKTLKAMKEGADVIFQARLQHENFAGYADFLVKVARPSDLGKYSYEPWDTKLAKKPKVYFIIQLCCYAKMLQAIQGVLPEYLTVVLGSNDKAIYRTTDFYAYFNQLRQDFLSQQRQFSKDNQPDPFQYADVGDWSGYVETLRDQRDHLSKIANITRHQIKRLNAMGITTCAELIADSRAFLPKLNAQLYQKLKAQAAIQKESEKSGKVEYQILPEKNTDERLGFRALPPHSDSDLFFDLEGFPFATNGLEYLWGGTYFDQRGKRQFWERWAHDHSQEKQALIDFVNFAYDRWQQDKSMHVYHYANYEIAVLKRLMGRYGVMENRIDDMLRAGVFVDLYQVVRHALLVGAPSYSIKKVERLYRPARETDVASGDESVVVYANWRSNPDGQTWQDSEILDFIRKYNIDDCDSTQELVDWLRDAQEASGIRYVPLDMSSVKQVAPIAEEPLTAEQKTEYKLRAIAADKKQMEDDRHIATVLADLMAFFQRENKPMWWRFFERRDMSFDELYDDPDCLVDCFRTEQPEYKSGKTARSQSILQYQYDVDQEFRNKRFKNAFVLGTENTKVGVASIDTEKGLIELKTKGGLPENIGLISYEYINAGTLEKSLHAKAQIFAERMVLPPAIRTFLLRQPPNISSEILLNIDKARDTEKLNLIIEAIRQMKHSFLSIQGPPGTGKSYTASNAIFELIREGKCVGITSNSHAAINHLMKAVAKLTVDKGTPVPMFKIQNDDDELFSLYPIKQVNGREAGDVSFEQGGVVGFTAWGAMGIDLKLDYLFVDEAGQVAVAKLVAMGHVAPNIVVMGDQMQLPQPVQGTHPGDSGDSILDYLLKDVRTIPADKGIFLNRTYRMHADVNDFISNMVYEGRLDNHPDCDVQRLVYSAHSELPHSGIYAVPVRHEGNKQASIEEVKKVRELVTELLAAHFCGKDGHQKPMTGDDILVVAPFNHQVNELKKELGFDARVGTVDLFQGQEAPVVIISMAASRATDSPRGVDFLLNLNRLNVAISRAQALAIVVYSNSLLDGSPSNINDIRRFNLFQTLINVKGDGVYG